jgi:hypothetical protein
VPLGNKLVILWTYADFMRAFYVLIAVFALLAWDLTLNDGRLFSATNAYVDQLAQWAQGLDQS